MFVGTEEMDDQLKALAAPAGNPGSVPSWQPSATKFWVSNEFFWILQAPSIHMVHSHVGKILIHIKINMNELFLRSYFVKIGMWFSVRMLS